MCLGRPSQSSPVKSKRVPPCKKTRLPFICVCSRVQSTSHREHHAVWYPQREGAQTHTKVTCLKAIKGVHTAFHQPGLNWTNFNNQVEEAQSYIRFKDRPKFSANVRLTNVRCKINYQLICPICNWVSEELFTT